jgi:hypothetical protein
MASWSAIVALSGFQYSGVTKSLTLKHTRQPGGIPELLVRSLGLGLVRAEEDGRRYRVAVAVAEGTLSCRRSPWG